LPREQHEALQQARAIHATEAGQQRYARRAGIEGTISQSVRSFGARRARYRGLPKTHLQQVMTAVAINVRRIIAWFDAVHHVTTHLPDRGRNLWLLEPPRPPSKSAGPSVWPDPQLVTASFFPPPVETPAQSDSLTKDGRTAKRI